eukprot:CAMPEP_0117445314 /NCGR_PEP_ID=MMETSP0759-20121206/5726_1 /TAXON_ID=63605 /ORGANISM="Percolomonas cosmopolitus, Strain WS" /LENGTH=806 /DNA_ID=CAMNT_0005237475 /DNA_START=29 /DNA_END=2449 /DNA_ORIENTATION=+
MSSASSSPLPHKPTSLPSLSPSSPSQHAQSASSDSPPPPPSSSSSKKSSSSSSSSSSKESSSYHSSMCQCVSQYIHSISVITFDLELGQKIQQSYPSRAESASQDLPYLSFPDSNTSLKEPELCYYFRLPKWWRDFEGAASVKEDEMQQRHNHDGNEENEHTTCKASSESMDVRSDTHLGCRQPLYGHVYFLQKPSPLISRGFIMKSLVVITPLPFIQLFQNLVRILGEAYFREMPERDVVEEKEWDGLERAYRESLLWPTIRTWHEMEDRILKVHWMGKEVRYRVPLMSWADEWMGQQRKMSRHTPGHNGGTHQSCLRATKSCDCMTERDKTLSSENDSLAGHQKSVSSQNLTKESLMRRNIDLKYDNATGEVLHATTLTPLKERLRGRRFIFQKEVNIFRTFRNQLDQLIHLWELVMVGDPILVLSPSPTQCCEAVLGLVSLIAPIFYAGDFRPYFTVHNAEYKVFASMGSHHGFESVILGVTNPFFIKAYEAWPNCLAVGTEEEYNTREEIKLNTNTSEHNSQQSPSNASYVNSLPSTSVEHIRKFSSNAFSFVSSLARKGRGSQKSVRTSVESRKKLMWEYEECLWTQRKFVMKQDQSWQSKLVNFDPCNLDDFSALRGNDNQILTFFEQLTNDFLFPLQQCFDKLLYSMKTFIVRSEHKKVMRPETFCAYIQKHGYRPEIFAASQELVQEMYTKFIYSKNFQSWLEDRIKQEYMNEVLYCSIDDVAGKYTEVGIVDLFLRLRDDIHEQKASGCYEEEIMERLEIFLRQLIQRMPESLVASLERTLKVEEQHGESEAVESRC